MKLNDESTSKKNKKSENIRKLKLLEKSERIKNIEVETIEVTPEPTAKEKTKVYKAVQQSPVVKVKEPKPIEKPPFVKSIIKRDTQKDINSINRIITLTTEVIKYYKNKIKEVEYTNTAIKELGRRIEKELEKEINKANELNLIIKEKNKEIETVKNKHLELKNEMNDLIELNNIMSDDIDNLIERLERI